MKFHLTRSTGKLGSAILERLLSVASNPVTSISPSDIPARFVVTVGRSESVQRLERVIPSSVREQRVTILIDQNIEAAKSASVVLLAFPASQARVVLAQKRFAEALEGKLVISMLGGTRIFELEDLLRQKSTQVPTKKFHIVRAISSISAAIGESMTVIGEHSSSIPPSLVQQAEGILSFLGSVKHVAPRQMAASTALCASGTALFALVLEAAVEGAVSLGLSREDFIQMAAQTMQGTARLALKGQHPALIKDQVVTLGGATARGIQTMEEGRARATIAKALRDMASTGLQRGSDSEQ